MLFGIEHLGGRLIDQHGAAVRLKGRQFIVEVVLDRESPHYPLIRPPQ